MTASDFAIMVKEMRDAQKAYFRDRKQGDLNRSKELERTVDKTLKELLDDRPALLPGFGGDR